MAPLLDKEGLGVVGLRTSLLYSISVNLNANWNYLLLAQDLGYGETSELMIHIEEVSKLFEAYASAILTPDS